MSCRIPKTLSVLYVAISLCHGKICETGNIKVTSSQCTDPDELFNSTVSVLPGSSITLTCSVVATSVNWNSSKFDMTAHVDSVMMIAGVAGIAFQLDKVMIPPDPLCSNATATIANIQESMDGLDLTCLNPLFGGFSSTVVIDVTDPPGLVSSETFQSCNSLITKWTALSDEPCPITQYHVNISNNVVEVNPNQTNHTYYIDDGDCGATLGIGVFAISVAGYGETSNTSITVICTPTNVTVVSISDITANIAWTHTDVPGVTDYKIMSMTTNGQSQPSKVPAGMSVGSVEVSHFTVSVTVTVTSLNAKSEAVFSSQETLPAIKGPNVVKPGSEMSKITFPFLYAVSETSVTWSPSNGTCMHSTLDQSISVSCSGLSIGVEYTVTIGGILNINGHMLPFTFSEMFVPMDSTPSPSEPSGPMVGSQSPVATSDLPLIVGIVVAVIVTVLLMQ